VLMLELIEHHDYGKSRFLRGTTIDEAKMLEVAAPPPPTEALRRTTRDPGSQAICPAPLWPTLVSVIQSCPEPVARVNPGSLLLRAAGWASERSAHGSQLAGGHRRARPTHGEAPAPSCQSYRSTRRRCPVQ